MKIVHLVGGDINGGAAKGVVNLHKSLLSHGVSSSIIIDSKHQNLEQGIISSSGTSKFKWAISLIRSFLDSSILKLFPNRMKTTFTPGWFGETLQRNVFINEADIINIHWVGGGYVSYKTLYQIKRLNIPILITLRDMNHFTGGCHYSMSCSNFKTGCSNCPQLGGKSKFDLAKLNSLIKKRIFSSRNFHFLSISDWLTTQARMSKILEGKNVKTIYNIVNHEDFRILGKEESRKILGLSDSYILLVGAINLDDYYKGGTDLLKLISTMKEKCEFPFQIVSFGKTFERLNIAGVNVHQFGYINDSLLLNMIYASSDVFLCLSRMEAFGKTVLESLYSGTPVITYDCTGPSELVENFVNGYIVEVGNIDALFKAVVLSRKVSLNPYVCRSTALSKFESGKTTKYYIDFCNDLIKNRTRDLK